jgi:molecular chaperone GrpE
MTPAQLDAVLADFRDWLARQPESSAEPPGDEVDLFTLVAQFTALRQEVNLQTRAVRAQQEQNAETLQQYGETLEALREPVSNAEEQIRPLLKSLIDAADAQMLALRELEKLRARIEELQLNEDPPASMRRLPLLARLAGAGRILERLNDLEKRRDPRPFHETIHDRIEAATTGLAMGLQRLERALRQHGIEPIPSVGNAFDPELMEVVEVVVDTDRPAGEVIEEVRRGYLWNSKSLRFAQVRVAK